MMHRLLPLLLLLFSFSSFGQQQTEVELETTLGTIRIQLFTTEAPVSSKNFLDYIDQGFYEGTIFHRTIPGFMIQGGGFTERLERKNTAAPISNESHQTPSNTRGTVAMARTNVPDSATSQFFINVVDNPYLDHKPGKPGYAVIGKVVMGMDIVDKIAQSPTQRVKQFANLPEQTVVIKTAKVLAPQ